MKIKLLGFLAVLPFSAWCQTANQDFKEETMDSLTIQADFWFKEGDFPRAVEILKMRFALDPKNHEFCTDLGWLLESINRHGEALAIYTQYRLTNLEDPDRSLPEAEYYFRRKLYAKVVATLGGGVPSTAHANTYRVLAHSYERLGRLKDSLKIWDEYLKRNPNDLQGQNNRERVRKKLENPS